METELQKTAIHFTDNYLINPTNPIEMMLIGAGGTGSQLLTCLARMNHALTSLEHPGLKVTLWDDDRVTEANLGRQLFAESELGMYKSACLINRVNRFFGTAWKAKTEKFTSKLNKDKIRASIYMTCVDSAAARFDVAEALSGTEWVFSTRNRPRYWIDFGNSQDTGQVVLSTIEEIKQPNSDKYKVVGSLPFVTDIYADQLKNADKTDQTPSCSLGEALKKQDLYINSTLAQMGASLLWNMLRNGMTENKGFFLNLGDFRCQPIKIS